MEVTSLQWPPFKLDLLQARVMAGVTIPSPTRDQAPAWKLLDVEVVYLGLFLWWFGCDTGRSAYYLESPAVTSTGTEWATKVNCWQR